VELHFPFFRIKGFLGDLAGMNDVVVDDQMDNLVVLELFTQLIDQLDEQGRALAFPCYPDEVFAPTGDGPGHIVFLVLAGGDHLLLSSWQHPVRSDFRVEMDVDLIGKQDNLIGGQRLDELTDFSQATLPFPGRPGAAYGGSGASLACPETLQDPTHR